MKIYHMLKVSYPARLTAIFLLTMPLTVSPKASIAQSPTARTPSAILGTVDFCPKRLWKIKQIGGCKRVQASQTDITLANDALAILNTLVKSEAFKTAVFAINFDPSQMKTCKGAVCSAPMTKEHIYDLIVSSSPQPINVTYYLHHKFDEGNQGFEDPKAVDTVFGNDEKIKGDRGFLASLMLHEWMHILGFHHDNPGTVCRSVPYKMNLVYSKVAPQLNLPSSASPCNSANQ